MSLRCLVDYYFSAVLGVISHAAGNLRSQYTNIFGDVFMATLLIPVTFGHLNPRTRFWLRDTTYPLLIVVEHLPTCFS